MSKKQNWTIIIFFLLLIFGFTAGSLLKPDTGFSEKENRVLASMPKLNLSDILDGTFSSDYETYLTDQFFWRNGWIGLKTRVERATGRQEINDVYFAKDGYLIEKHTGSFSTDTAKRNVTYLAQFLETQQASLGSEHVKALIAPNAVDVLADKLPPFAENTEEEEYLTALFAALPAGSYTDVRETLLAHSSEYIYYRTDHHWTTLAAWYAYDQWADECGISHAGQESYTRETLSEDFLGTIEAKVNCSVSPDTIEAWIPEAAAPYTFTVGGDEATRTADLYDESYLATRDKYAVFFGGNQGLVEITAGAGSGRKLLVIKDSYANCFAPFAIQDFDEIAMVDLRYFNERLSDYMAGHGFTDVLVLYNASGFAEDTSLAKLGL